MKAGICENASEYLFSGYSEFNGEPRIIDIDVVKQILGDKTYQEKEKGNFNEKINYIDMDTNTDEICKEIIKNFVKSRNVALQTILQNDNILMKLLTELVIKNDLPYSCVEKNLLINRKRIAKLCPKKGQV